LIREYEFTVISRADLPETETSKLLSKYEGLMTKDGGQILKKDVWGSKKLAYPINKNFKGVYTHYDFFGAPEHVKEIERLMRIDENVLRYMTVKLGDEGSEEAIEKRKVELSKPKATVQLDDGADE
jgi:small subunit ribosomal protein S6